MRDRGDLASYLSRVGATILDTLVVGGVAVVLAVIAGAAGAPEETTGYIVIGAALLGTLIYAPVLMCRTGEHNGQTLGKQALSIRVVRQDAQPMTAQPALLREFVGKGLLGLIPFYTIVDDLFPLGDRRRQAIHDKLASTFVVHADAVPDLGPGAPDAFGTERLDADTAPSGWAPPASRPHDDAPAPATGWAPPVARPRPGADAPAPGAEWAPPASARGSERVAPAPEAPADPPPEPSSDPDREADDEVRGPFGPSSPESR